MLLKFPCVHISIVACFCVFLLLFVGTSKRQNIANYRCAVYKHTHKHSLILLHHGDLSIALIGWSSESVAHTFTRPVCIQTIRFMYMSMMCLVQHCYFTTFLSLFYHLRIPHAFECRCLHFTANHNQIHTQTTMNRMPYNGTKEITYAHTHKHTLIH